MIFQCVTNTTVRYSRGSHPMWCWTQPYMVWSPRLPRPSQQHWVCLLSQLPMDRTVISGHSPPSNILTISVDKPNWSISSWSKCLCNIEHLFSYSVSLILDFRTISNTQIHLILSYIMFFKFFLAFPLDVTDIRLSGSLFVANCGSKNNINSWVVCVTWFEKFRPLSTMRSRTFALSHTAELWSYHTASSLPHIEVSKIKIHSIYLFLFRLQTFISLMKRTDFLTNSYDCRFFKDLCGMVKRKQTMRNCCLTLCKILF